MRVRESNRKGSRRFSRRSEGSMRDDKEYVKALITFLKYDAGKATEVEEIGYGDVGLKFKTPDGIYDVLNNYEADEAFMDTFLLRRDDEGVSGFTGKFQSWILDNVVDETKLHKKVIASLYIDIASNPENYEEFINSDVKEDLIDALITQAIDYQDEELQEFFTSSNLYDNEEDYFKVVEDTINNASNEVLFEAALKANILDKYLDDVSSAYLESLDNGIISYALLKDNKSITSAVNWNKVAEEVKKTETRGVLLAIDGKENTINYEGTDYFIYKQ